MTRRTTLVVCITMMTIGIIGGIFFLGRNADDAFGAIAGSDFIERFHATKDAVLIDVRTPGEFASGHIDGAINIDIASPQFANEISALDRHTPYFVYCRSGNRSAQAARFMKQQGFTQVTDLAGGVVSSPTLLQ